MLIGICPKCGAIYRGWALKSPWYQTCDRCGEDIDIKDREVETIAASDDPEKNQPVGFINCG